MKTNGPRRTPRRMNRPAHEGTDDPYQALRKLAESTVCPVCKAVWIQGRWTWAPSWPMGAPEEICPACRRTRDRYPAGVLTLAGAYALAHADELIHFARRQEAVVKAARPLQRIMAVGKTAEAITITTTDIHLPRRIGDALRHAYKGKLGVHYDEAGYYARVNWSREK